MKGFKDVDFSFIKHVRIHKEQFDAIEKDAEFVILTCIEDGRSICFDRRDLRGKGLFKHLPIIDCNNCGHLNITEEEQQKMFLSTEYKYPHRCLLYNKPVKHNCMTVRDHDSRLYPCEECIKDDYKNFVIRKED